MGPYELFPSQSSALTGSQTGCGGCRYSQAYSIQGIRNQTSGLPTGLSAFSISTPAQNQTSITLPLYMANNYPSPNQLLLSGAVTVTHRRLGSSGDCMGSTGQFFYPTGSGQICYESGIVCDALSPCYVIDESVSIRINPSLYGPNFLGSMPSGIWRVTVINTNNATGALFNQWVLPNNNGTTGFVYASGYSVASGVTYQGPDWQQIECGTSTLGIVDIDYFVFGAATGSSWNGTGTYFVPNVTFTKTCTACTGI